VDVSAQDLSENLGARRELVGTDLVSEIGNVCFAKENIGHVCSAEEGNVTPGVRRIVRFTVMTPNIGSADINLGDPNKHIAANDGLYEFASCHNHYHFRHYATYELVAVRRGER
jgi:hypothetical protein